MQYLFLFTLALLLALLAGASNQRLADLFDACPTDACRELVTYVGEELGGLHDMEHFNPKDVSQECVNLLIRGEFQAVQWREYVRCYYSLFEEKKEKDL
jgi:hypothetical protein